MIINDLVQPVVGKCRNRTDVIPIAPYFIALAILEFTENTEFEELKTTGPLTNFVPNIAEYPIVGYDINGINGNPFINVDDTKLTFVSSWFIYFEPSGSVTPGQSTGKNIDSRDIRVVEPMSKVLGIPSTFCLFGDRKNKGKIIVGQMPDNPYPTQMRYQRQHPFSFSYGNLLSARYDSTKATLLASSQIYMPDDWSDLIVYSASEKICDDIGMNEIGLQYHQKLYGYKDKKGNDMPGLVQVRQTQQQRQSQRNSRALRPYVRRYTG